MKNILSILFILAISISVNAQKVLFLDAGHGGQDPGAVSVTGVTESQINQLFVTELKELAESKGMKVILLSDANEYTPATERAKTINDYKLKNGESACLISIHANFSANDPSKSGSELYILDPTERSTGSKELAEKLGTVLGAPILEKGLLILKSSSLPSVLIETGYLSNQQDLQDLSSPDMRTLMVRKIISALE